MRSQEERDEGTLRIAGALAVFVLAVVVASALAALSDLAGLWEFDTLSGWTPAAGIVALGAYVWTTRA